MTELRRDAAYIRTKSNERTTDSGAQARLSRFDEQVCELLGSAHTVKSAAKALSQPTDSSLDELEDRVAESMRRLLQAELIQLSPDS